MLWRNLTHGVLVAAVAVAGCGMNGSVRSYPDSYPGPRPLGAGVPAAPAPASRAATDGAKGAQAEEPDEPAGELTLRRALALALTRNPELAAFSWAVRMAEAEQLQAGLLPNPELEAEFENFAGPGDLSGSTSLETTVALSQLIELGGKREKRVALASAERRLAGWDYEAKRIEVLTDVAKRFIAALAAQEKAALARESLDLAETVLDTARKRVGAGKAPPTEETKAGVEVASAELEVKRSRRELAVAKQRLAAMWASTSPRFPRVIGNLGTIPEIPKPESLMPFVSRNTEVARWDAEMAQREAAADLAKAGAVPDVTLGVGYRHFKENHDNAMLAALSVPLPIYDRNQGEISKTRFGVTKARLDRQAAEAKVRTDLAEAYQELASAYEEAAALRDAILPAAESSFKASQTSFQSGKGNYLDVLDAQRTLTELRGKYLDAQASYHRARADVEGLIGQSLDARNEPEPVAKGENDER